MKARLWTAANVVMLLMFAFSVVVQFNDPDPLGWMAIYGAAAVACGVEIRRRTPFPAAAAIAALALAWGGIIALRAHDVPIPSLFASWEMQDVRVEEAREMYGLAIIAVWMTAITVASWRRRRRDASANG